MTGIRSWNALPSEIVNITSADRLKEEILLFLSLFLTLFHFIQLDVLRDSTPIARGVWKSGKPESGTGAGIGTGSETGIGTGTGTETYIKNRDIIYYNLIPIQIIYEE